MSRHSLPYSTTNLSATKAPSDPRMKKWVGGSGKDSWLSRCDLRMGVGE